MRGGRSAGRLPAPHAAWREDRGDHRRPAHRLPAAGRCCYSA